MRLSLNGVRQVVVIGAHCDDIEIAAGATLLSLASPDLRVHYVVCAGSPQRHAEAVTAAHAFVPGAQLSFGLHDLPDGRLPGHWAEVKQIIEDAAAVLPQADLVLSPWRGDAHQDHRLLGELAPTAFRNALHLQYEIPKWDGDLGRPNLYLPVSSELARRKAELLDKCFPSQHGRDWWSEETFLSLMKLRGIECRSPYAEAFHVNKAVMELTPTA
ncbi:MAG TPA: PIG-L family deacetylase [Micromonosporaceae bacterium]|nr:PIG-L family deacetylase [Micromonosporaceae bacterium]